MVNEALLPTQQPSCCDGNDLNKLKCSVLASQSAANITKAHDSSLLASPDTYTNADTQKMQILLENKGRSGIYR